MTSERLRGLKIGLLVESDYYEPEIWYYKHRFAEEGVDLRLMSRLWGQASLTFKGHEHQAPLECNASFENMSDGDLRSFAAMIVPSGMVADRLRYTEDVAKPAPAADFLRRCFAEKQLLKGIICHGLWLVAPVADVVRGRKLVCHNNLYGDAKAYGATYVDQDVVVDGDLITARTGAHCHQFARAIIERLASR